MPETIIVALMSLVGTAIGAFSGIRLVAYRVEQLEKKVDKHNCVIERTYKLETQAEGFKTDVAEVKHDLVDIKHDLADLRQRSA